MSNYILTETDLDVNSALKDEFHSVLMDFLSDKYGEEFYGALDESVRDYKLSILCELITN